MARSGPLLAASVFALVLGAVGGALAASGGGGEIHVCVREPGGALRLATRCRRRETSLVWNVQGPTGPRGSAGAKGPRGDQGPKGDQGPAGPSTGAAGGSLTGNYPNPAIAAGAVGTTQLGTIPAALVTNSGDEAPSNTTETVLTFNAETYDNDSIHSTSTNTSRLTAPVSGIYEITGEIDWDAGGGTVRDAVILLDGSEVAEADQAPLSGANVVQQVTAQIQMNAGDYAELEVYQDTGGSLDVNHLHTWFALHWVAP